MRVCVGNGGISGVSAPRQCYCCILMRNFHFDAAAGSGHGDCSVWAGTKSSGPGRDARRQGRGWATGGAAPAAARRQGQLATAKALARGY